MIRKAFYQSRFIQLVFYVYLLRLHRIASKSLKKSCSKVVVRDFFSFSAFRKPSIYRRSRHRDQLRLFSVGTTAHNNVAILHYHAIPTSHRTTHLSLSCTVLHHTLEYLWHRCGTQHFFVVLGSPSRTLPK